MSVYIDKYIGLGTQLFGLGTPLFGLGTPLFGLGTRRFGLGTPLVASDSVDALNYLA